MKMTFKKYSVVFFFFLLSPAICFAQDTAYKDKGYDKQAIDYIISEIEKSNATFDDCIKYTKPFSKWDLQSTTVPEVWIFDELQKASILPNFLFGALSKYFKKPITEVKEMPNTFLRNAVNNYGIYEKDALNNASEYFDLVELVKKSGSVIFLNQDNLQRANDIFYENGIYWKYVIPDGSPFPVSGVTTTEIPQQFSPEVVAVLGRMDSLGIYAIYNDDSFIYLLKDGMLDNSFGYYFRDNDINYYKENHLFHLMAEELIMPRFYYYVVN